MRIMMVDQSHLCCGYFLTRQLERGSKTAICSTQMSSAKPQLTPKMIHLMLQSPAMVASSACVSGRQSQAWSSMKEPAFQKRRMWLQARVRMIMAMRGRLVKKYSLQGLAMLKAIMEITQMLLTKRNIVHISRPQTKPFQSYETFALSIPPQAWQQSGFTAWKMAMMEICPATWMLKATIIWHKLVKQKRELLGRSTLSVLAVLVQPMKTMKKKLRQRSQQRYWKSAGYCRNFSLMTVVVYSMSEQMARMLKREKLVARPALHSLMSSTMEVMLGICEVKGAEMEASACERERPMSACLRAPQSLAPSPHIDTFMSMCWKAMTILALSLGFVLAKTEVVRMKVFSTSDSSVMFPLKISLKALPVTHNWQFLAWALFEISSMNTFASLVAITTSSFRFCPDEPLLLAFCSSIWRPFLGEQLLWTIMSGLAGGGWFLELTSVVASSSSWKSKNSSVNLPSTKSQMIMPLPLLEISHLQLMFEPVRVLSPVIITHPISAAFRVAMAPLVSGFSLFSNTSKPLKTRFLSASSLVMLCTADSSMFLLAMLSTLNPCEAYSFKI